LYPKIKGGKTGEGEGKKTQDWMEYILYYIISQPCHFWGVGILEVCAFPFWMECKIWRCLQGRSRLSFSISQTKKNPYQKYHLVLSHRKHLSTIIIKKKHFKDLVSAHATRAWIGV
jgi:hypothetical protein